MKLQRLNIFTHWLAKFLPTEVDEDWQPLQSRIQPFSFGNLPEGTFLKRDDELGFLASGTKETSLEELK